MTMPESETGTLPVVRDTELEEFRTVGYWLSLSETGEDTPAVKGASAALRLYYAARLELPPLAAQELSVIKGKLSVGAQLMRALAEREGYRVERVESTDETCTARLYDKGTGQILGETTFTIEDARRAGLIRDRSAWKTHPARMLWARASKNVIVDYAPAVALGMVLDDEVPEITGEIVAETDDADDPDHIDWPEPSEQDRMAVEEPQPVE
jgi:hypothetical protein